MSSPRMGFMQWLATEGGRKCPQCGRYAKPSDLGNLSFTYQTQDGGTARVSMYGHLPGKGCNKPKGIQHSEQGVPAQRHDVTGASPSDNTISPEREWSRSVEHHVAASPGPLWALGTGLVSSGGAS